MSRDQMNFRCEKPLRDKLIVKENYSEFIRDACWEKFEREGDHALIDLEIQNYEQLIKKCKDRKKTPKVLTKKVKEVLQREFESFKQGDRMMIQDDHNLSWIEARIIPQITGCGLNKEKILAIFQDHYKKKKVLIDVR